ncbi:MAG: patatin-like phospholipase family protein [Rhodospirillales bacterium]|nr:patatin-like phospholipase family protein [Rhodospirillales bacterium]MBR9815511.1 patatin-like phospholipase family protein [Rhodospirillales bacterium]
MQVDIGAGVFEGRSYRILSIDGGGIRGVFPAAFLASLEEDVDQPIGSYFDLIAGTSTGGIIALGLGLGKTAAEIQELYEKHGPAIFGQDKGTAANIVLRNLKKFRRVIKSKHDSENLHDALKGILQNKKIGESKTRLIIPAWHAETERVYIYKTAHHERLRTDYKCSAVDAAMATAAAPTYLKPHLTGDGVELVDGGVWANNPIGVAVTEAVGLLGWPRDQIKVLSIGTINEVVARSRGTGILSLASGLTRLFMAGQAHSALGTAKILTGDGHHGKKAIWRVDQNAPQGRYTLDDTSVIREMVGRAKVEAREQLPELRRHFFYEPAPEFVPVYQLEEAIS